jgi:hypothetical protein
MIFFRAGVAYSFAAVEKFGPWNEHWFIRRFSAKVNWFYVHPSDWE